MSTLPASGPSDCFPGRNTHRRDGALRRNSRLFLPLDTRPVVAGDDLPVEVTRNIREGEAPRGYGDVFPGALVSAYALRVGSFLRVGGGNGKGDG